MSTKRVLLVAASWCFAGALPSMALQQGGLASPAPAAKIRVGGNVQQTKLVKKVTPTYPPEAKQQRVQGVVRLQATIGKDGEVKSLDLIQGPPLLVDSAVEAVRQWVYQSTLLNGNPVEVETEIDVNYTLAQ